MQTVGKKFWVGRVVNERNQSTMGCEENVEERRGQRKNVPGGLEMDPL